MVRRLHDHKGRRLLPRAEIVEKRLLLATYLVTNASDSGTDSLRQAIVDANSNPGANVIDFAIVPSASSYTIDLQTPLPAITHPVLIDGTSQTGYSVTPIIEINGGGLTGDGLLLAPGSDGSTIKGLDIANFAGAGIHIQSNDNLIQSNFLGTDLTGTIALGNQNGLFIDGGSGNTIGGSSTGAGNLISANQGSGILMILTTRNLIAGNIVGASFGLITDPSAMFRPLGNVGTGILIGSDSTNNTVGLPGAGNLVVANEDGIVVSDGSDSNLISGNAVGTTLFTGSEIGIGPPVDLGNKDDGIKVSSSSANTIGGANQLDSSGQFTVRGGNVVSGNKAVGIRVLGNDSFGSSSKQGNLVLGNLVGTSADGKGPVANGNDGILLGNSAANTVGGANGFYPDGTISSLSGNLISGNTSAGVELNGNSTTGNLVLGNRIGMDLTGQTAVPNDLEGVLVYMGASNNTIGAANVDGSAANFISGNAMSGIEIRDTSTANQVLGNRVGVTAQGTARLPNLGDGILLNAAGNVIGGTVQGAGNVISGNLKSGVQITNSVPGFATTNADDNLIVGNLIGVDPSGLSSGVGNDQSGVEIDNASGTTIGGVTSAAGTGPGNVISGNSQDGVHLTGSSSKATVIEGNIVGLDAAGTAHQGNLLAGILLDGVSGNSVGANQTGTGNVLSYNGTAGLEIDQGSNNTAQGNLIGTDPTGTSALGNLQNGVVILDSTLNTIGGTEDLAANVISGNNLSGIAISGTAAWGNVVLGNRIGTDRSGTQTLGNGRDGVLIDSALSNTVGGTAAGAGNLISANRSHGIEIGGTAADPARMNAIEGNRIGTTATGSASLGNAQDGVFLAAGASNNTVGGTVPAAGNLISANLSNGVELVTGATGNVVAGNLIGTDASGEAALGNNNVGVVIYNTSGNRIGGLTASAGRAPGNVISGNRSSGVLISGPLATGNQLQGNLIGTDRSGVTALPNASTGVTVDSAPNNLIGGDQPGEGNVIAANRAFGVFLLGTTATGNRIAGNLIGTNSAGAANLGNTLDGLVLSAAPGNTIGGLVAADRNVISGNGGNGIDVLNIVGTDGVVIMENFIGTNPSGLGRLGNGLAGVLLNGVSGTVIAGAALPNLISGNAGNGIYLLGSSAAGTVVRGSSIGTDISGTAGLGNGGDGIALEGALACTIGGTAAGQGNLISGNAGNGIHVYGSTASSNVFLGNTIGTVAQGTAVLPNAGFGISIEGTTDNLVQADLISGNAQGGVQITGSGAGGNRIFGCTIGTDRAGQVALGNGLASLNNGIGVFINGAEGNLVGGPGQGNLISGNATAGVYIFGRFASANTVQGNRIGTNATGQRPIVQNGSTLSQQVGVLINDAPGLDIRNVSPGPGNTIGGSTANAGNLISGNIVGIMISGAQSSGNVVAGNLIGPSGSGGAGAGNTVGVYINGAPRNTIGVARGNVISGNSSVGVYILGSPSTGNMVAGGNLIGLAPDGIKRLPNPTGVYIENAPGNVIGGGSSVAANWISANRSVGVYILGAQSVGNVVEGNLIGSNIAGGRAGNGQYGVLLYNAPANTVVRSGPQTNRITGSGIANYRVFLGGTVSANPSGGQAATHSTSSHRVGKSASSRGRVLVGRSTPAGPMRRATRAR